MGAEAAGARELGAAERREVVSDAVVIVAKAEAASYGLPVHVRAFEYRHVPDPVHVEGVLIPRFERVRTARAPHPTMEETP